MFNVINAHCHQLDTSVSNLEWAALRVLQFTLHCGELILSCVYDISMKCTFSRCASCKPWLVMIMLYAPIQILIFTWRLIIGPWCSLDWLLIANWSFSTSVLFYDWCGAAQSWFGQMHLQKLLLRLHSLVAAHLTIVVPASSSSAATTSTWTSR